MKQIDITKLYSQKRCLIVDNSPEERTLLKRLLVEFGATDVATAGSAEEAVELCERKSFDVVLSDYDLGSGKNGQQLIEELRFHEFLKNTAIYILITAQTDSLFVLQAIEFQPDDYLSKPLSKNDIRKRVNAAILKKEALAEVLEAIDKKDINNAITLCGNVIKYNTPYKIDALKILGDLYLRIKAYPQANALYKNLLSKMNNLAWAKIGYARSYYATNNFDKAENLARELAEEFPRCVDALELLAKALEAKHLFVEAQYVMTQACELTPRSVVRQRLLGRLSETTGNLNAALHAYKAAVKHGRNSCYESYEDYIKLSDTLLKVSKNNSPARAKEYTEEAVDLLKSIRKKFKRQPLGMLRAYLFEAAHLETQGRQEQAEIKTCEAVALLPDITDIVLSHSSVEFNIGCAQALILRGKYQEGEQLLQRIAALNTDNLIAIKIDKYLREPVTKEGIAFAASLNEKGIKLYDEKRFHESANYFRDVLQELPNHIGLNLNLIQALLNKGKHKTLSREEHFKINDAIRKITGMTVGKKYQSRLDYLIKQNERLASISNT